MAIKILFINPSLPYDGIMYEHEIPIHLVYLANFLMEKMIPSPSIEFLDIDLERRADTTFDPFDIGHVERLLKDAIDQAFRIGRDDHLFVLVSCYYTFQYLSSRVLLESIKALRENRAIDVHKVVIGGYHPTVLPDDFKDLGVDIVIRGEGETALLEVLSRDNVPNPRVEIIEGSIVKDLDTLPLVDFTVYEKYLPLYTHLSIALSRGCPHNCNFCVEKKYKSFKCEKASWRAYSPKRAILEIQNVIKTSDTILKDGGDKAIGFYDPIFGINDQWLLTVLHQLKGMKSGYRFWAETRIDAFKRENMHAMKAANIMFMLGLESASPRILSLMNKTNDPLGYLAKLEKIMISSKDIGYGPFVLNLIFNFPGETLITQDETFAYLHQLVDIGGSFTTGSNFYHFMPGDAVFSNLDAWERRHGTRIHCKDWWKSQETTTAGYILDASSELSIEESINHVHRGMKDIFDHIIVKEPIFPKKLIMMKRIAQEEKTYKNRLMTMAGILGTAPYTA